MFYVNESPWTFICILGMLKSNTIGTGEALTRLNGTIPWYLVLKQFLHVHPL